MLVLQNTPAVEVDGIPNTSRWVPAWHPIIYYFQRNDFAIYEIGDNTGSGGGIEATFVGDLTSELNDGDTVYLYCQALSLDTNLTIDSFSYNSGTGLTTIIFDYATSIGTVGTEIGYINLITTRLYYRCEVDVLMSDDVTEVLPNVYAQFTPDAKGNIKADIQQWCQELVDATQDATYDDTVIQTQASYLGQPFNIIYREFYKTPTGTVTSSWSIVDPTQLMCVSHSVLQLKNYFGNNMGQFVMFPYDPNSSKGLFLTKFKQPRYCLTFPYDISFISDKNILAGLGSTPLQYFQKYYDVNRNVLSNSSTNLNNYNGYVNRLTLQNNYKIFPPNVDTIDVWLGYPVPTGYTDPTPVSWVIPAIIGSGGEIVIGTNLGQSLGTANFDTDLNTTMTQLVANINSASTFGGSDNIYGFTATWNSGTSTLTIIPPLNSGATYNGKIIARTDALGSLPPSPQTITQTLSGGITGTIDYQPISEIKTIKVDSDCKQNPICLKWLNPYGGFDTWVFNWDNFTSDVTSNEIGFQKYIESLANNQTRYEVLSKDNQQQIECGAENLTNDEIEGIRYLLRSPKVLMFTGLDPNTGISQWLGVTIVSDTFQIYEALENKQSIDFIIQPPQDYNQNQ